MSQQGGILGAGVLVARQLAATGMYLDGPEAPVMNVQHTFPSGAINLSAGSNPSAGFNITPVAIGNTQIMTGPNLLVSNTLSVPNQFSVGFANVANALSVVGPTTLTGPLTATGNVLLQGNTTISGSANVVSNLTVGSTVFVPNLKGNTAALVGPMANCYIETTSNLASTTSALYLSPGWRFKVVSSGGLATQSFYNGQWNNVDVRAPTGVSLTIAQLTTPTT